ncbi:MAG: GAF domain-containing protein, partial [Gammaproteobacteria bacterium]|nr:GAF domain-containing protein [Gammaproteobacteria bacterium]
MFNNWRIRDKVMIISIISIMGFMIYLVSNYFVAQSTDNRLTNIKNSDFPVFEIVNETSIAITAIKLNLSAAVDTGEQDAMIAADTLYQNVIDDLRRIPVLTPPLDSKVRNIIADLESYFSASKIVAKGLLNDNIDSDTLFILVPKIDAHFSALEEGLAQLRLQVKDSFSKSLQLVRDDNRRSWERGSYLSLAIIFSLLTISYYITRGFTKGLSHAVHVADKIAEGNWDTAIKITSNDETGHLLTAISTMRDKLKRRAEEDHRSEQLQSRVAELNERMRGDQSINELCRNILDYLTPITNCQVGALYLFNHTTQELELVSSYAFSQRKGIQNSFKLGESLVGQVGLEKKQICISELPENYLPIDSGLGGSRPNNILLTPVMHEAELCAVIELASLYPIDEQSMLL